MEKNLTIRGLPQVLALDGWWLVAAPSGDDGADGDAAANAGLSRRARRLGAILILVALADLLFWRHGPGLSLALFAAAIFALSMAQGVVVWRGPAVLLVLAALPVIDHLQALSLTFLVLGQIVALLWSRHPDASAAQLIRSAIRFLGKLPGNWVRVLDPRRLSVGGSALRDAGAPALALRRMLRNWALPVGGSLVFLALLMEANPVLARLLQIDLDLWQTVRRALFWAGTAVFVSPFLLPMDDPLAKAPQRDPSRWRLTGFGINAGAVLRALVLFNLLIAVQSLTDLLILLGGADLSAGMTLAEYAHRGAYPLLATALIAAAFALTARPFLAEHRLMRPLMLVWLAQNMVLCGAAALRLELYIESFGLTYLRLHALIWMGLVAAGLSLLIWQVLRRRSNDWLGRRVAVLLVTTLYLCSFVNFAQIIAAQNVTRPDPDRAYLCSLGPLASGPILASGVGRRIANRIDLGDCEITAPRIRNWREWGFRTWSAHRYVRQVSYEARP
ncbi:DUF4173 domain-containing protein [uncultured Paracoccus sp.]|uniref:DUF4153 domain-containing protein n=1 Tax=uncultured Paracoccus sp. TaxID=189685 RepID=UPI00261C39FA|nr:DUF4173 domain-containing protein [uncultured Paracoccus sp.]